jgi:hypothetical protein
MATDNAVVTRIEVFTTDPFAVTDRHSAREGIMVYNGTPGDLKLKFGEDGTTEDYSIVVGPTPGTSPPRQRSTPAP